MTAHTNYNDRTVDLLIFQGVKAAGEAQVDMSLGEAGSICTGIQKAAQTFVTLFLTDKGSVVGEDARGTDFLSLLKQGAIRDDASLQTQFRFAALDVLNYDSVSRPAGTLPDEILEEATLVSYDLQPGYIEMKVKLTTLVGESREIILPVDTVIR